MAIVEAIKCQVHLIALAAGVDATSFLDKIANAEDMSTPYLVKGRPHGWVHRPHRPDVQRLTNFEWTLFLLTEVRSLPTGFDTLMKEHIQIPISVPVSEFELLVAQRDSTPLPISGTPALPPEWSLGRGIPHSAILQHAVTPLRPGELCLDSAMASFLSDALPPTVRDRPVSLFNLFRYREGDSTIHDTYMDGFKRRFGPAAGARVKFMGPVGSGSPSMTEAPPGDIWDEANLVQYDSIWHYAYMLSTEVYADLNKEKITGLLDTCILCVSEVEL